jgi:hypothetical protein
MERWLESARQPSASRPIMQAMGDLLIAFAGGRGVVLRLGLLDGPGAFSRALHPGHRMASAALS